jgi:hypothetical protein
MKKLSIMTGGLLLLLVLIFLFFLYLPSNVVITMERGLCLGPCPAYKVTIYGDGRIVYRGRYNVSVTGIRIGIIPQDKIRELVDEFDRINYFYLHYQYIWSNGETVDNLPATETSITINGHKSQVHDYYGAPQELKDLERKIDEIAGTERWIGDGG